jgi:hypothetical protein
MLVATPTEPSSWLRRNRAAISAWVDRLGTVGPAEDNPETEAASWYLALSKESRVRLETDVERLRSGNDDLEGVVEGPLGELLKRYSGLIGLEFPARDFESPDLSSTFRQMEKADPLWAADWKGFLDSLGEPDSREEG